MPCANVRPSTSEMSASTVSDDNSTLVLRLNGASVTRIFGGGRLRVRKRGEDRTRAAQKGERVRESDGACKRDGKTF